MGVGSFMAAGMILPMSRFALDPVFKADAQGDLIATGVKESELGKEPIKVDFKFEQEDAWYTSEVTEFAWVYKDGNEIVALSPVCKHLGCTVQWNGDKSNLINSIVHVITVVMKRTVRIFQVRRH